MTYREHIASHPPSPYSLKSKIFTAVEALLAVICFLLSVPMVIFSLGAYGLILGPLYVLTVLTCLIVLAFSKKPRHGLHMVIRILLALPILTAIAYLVLIGTGIFPIC